MNRALAVCLLVSIGGCTKQSTDPALASRIAALEARVVAQDQQLADMRAQSATVELAAFAAKLEALSAQIAALEDKLAKGAPAARPKRPSPDPAKVYAVPVGTSPVDGAAPAKVTIVIAFDFACRYCRRAWDTLEALKARYKRDLRVVYKHYVVHPEVAMYPAQATCAASRQGSFMKLANLVWKKGFDARKLDDAHIDRLAKEARLDLKRYRADVESCLAEVKDDGTLMRKLALDATPSFFINGRFLEGAKSESTFAALIDEELAKANAAIAAGTPADRFYETEILAKGLTEVTAP